MKVLCNEQGKVSMAYPKRWLEVAVCYCLNVLLLFMSDEVKLNLNRRNIR